MGPQKRDDPMTFEPKDIQKLAHLARMGVSEKDQAIFAEDLNSIINWVSILQSAPTDTLEPLTHPHDGATPLREDVASEPAGSQRLFANAAQHEDNLFLVPQVIQ